MPSPGSKSRMENTSSPRPRKSTAKTVVHLSVSSTSVFDVRQPVLVSLEP